MKLRRNRRKSDDEETSYWLSYSDMMAGLLLVFVLIISFTIMQAKAQYEQKEEELAEQALIIYAQQADLLNKENELLDKETLLTEAQSQLEDQKTQLEDAQTQLEDQQTLLADQQTQLEDAQTQLDEQKSALDAVKELLANQQALLDEKEALVSSQQEELQAQQEQLDRIIGVKAELIEALKTRFADTSLSVFVDEKTGAITLDSSILFDTEEYFLTEDGAVLLSQFVPIYISVLLSPEFSGYVSEIIIEGHTDTDGTFLHNLELSQQRALAVASFCLEPESGVLTVPQIDSLRDILTANGRSYSDPVFYPDGTVNMDASRRVEFKFRLNDEEMVQEMIDILNENQDTGADE